MRTRLGEETVRITHIHTYRHTHTHTQKHTHTHTHTHTHIQTHTQVHIHRYAEVIKLLEELHEVVQKVTVYLFHF